MRNEAEVPKRFPNAKRPRLVAIVGGSGAGKSWLAARLEKKLGKGVKRLSLDDFYRDRSHLPETRRGLVNFDHPRAIDWDYLEFVLQNWIAGKTSLCPRYDFATHTRRKQKRILKPGGIVIMEGLWLLRRPSIRRLFDVRIFLDCSQGTRYDRRLARDLAERGRDVQSVRKQFRDSVVPMHRKFVASQRRWATVVLNPNTVRDGLRRLVDQLRPKQKNAL